MPKGVQVHSQFIVSHRLAFFQALPRLGWIASGRIRSGCSLGYVGTDEAGLRSDGCNHLRTAHTYGQRHGAMRSISCTDTAPSHTTKTRRNVCFTLKFTSTRTSSNPNPKTIVSSLDVLAQYKWTLAYVLRSRTSMCRGSASAFPSTYRRFFLVRRDIQITIKEIILIFMRVDSPSLHSLELGDGYHRFSFHPHRHQHDHGRHIFYSWI